MAQHQARVPNSFYYTGIAVLLPGSPHNGASGWGDQRPTDRARGSPVHRKLVKQRGEFLLEREACLPAKGLKTAAVLAEERASLRLTQRACERAGLHGGSVRAKVRAVTAGSN